MSTNKTESQFPSSHAGRFTYETIRRTDRGRRLKNVTRTHRSVASSTNSRKKTFFLDTTWQSEDGTLSISAWRLSFSHLSPCQVPESERGRRKNDATRPRHFSNCNSSKKKKFSRIEDVADRQGTTAKRLTSFLLSSIETNIKRSVDERIHDVSNPFAVRVTDECRSADHSHSFDTRGKVPEHPDRNYPIFAQRSLLFVRWRHNEQSIYQEEKLVSESIDLFVFSELKIVENKVMQTVNGNIDLHEGCLCVWYINFFFCFCAHRVSSERGNPARGQRRRSSLVSPTVELGNGKTTISTEWLSPRSEYEKRSPATRASRDEREEEEEARRRWIILCCIASVESEEIRQYENNF